MTAAELLMRTWSAAPACRALALAALLTMAPPWATADVVSGSFTGVANDAQFEAGLPPLPTFNQAPLTGTFRIDTALVGPPENVDPGFALYRLPAGVLELSFTVLGQTYHYGNNGIDSAVTLAHDASGQGLMFGADFYGPLAHSGSLSLGGDSGVFFDGLDLASFHPGPVDLRFVEAHFRLAPDIGARVLVSALVFDGVTPEVPEPSTWLMGVLGLALVLHRGLRRRQAVHTLPVGLPRLVPTLGAARCA